MEKNVILIVDDRYQNVDLLEAFLAPLGYEIIPARSGKQAFEKLSDNHIDLILLDVMMPGMDGFEVTRRIRNIDEYRMLPIILVTSLRETEDRIKGIEAGCDDFITKPVDRIELIARIRSLLKVKAYNDLLKNYRKELEADVAGRTSELAELNAGLEHKVLERTESLNRSLSVQNELNAQLIQTSGELEKEKQKIQEINKVLSEKSVELENEKDELEKRNKIMENDLDMARIIQKCFIPAKSPVAAISFQYKSMDKVGGDFFDFIRFSNSDLIGIFISDVSGHGIQAAFITAMIKSSIYQNSTDNCSPSSVLENLNDILFNNTADNFVTAFYGIFNFKTREFIYSKAGHNLPYIVYSDKSELINSISNAIPLAIHNNEILKNLGKGFINETVVLEKGCKLVLYTDGLTETVKIKNMEVKRGEDFEREKLDISFRTHFKKPADLFIKGVYNDLIEFRGSDDFEDDVCIICADVA